MNPTEPTEVFAIAIFHYEFPFNEQGEQVWSWRHVECFDIDGNGPGSVNWHVERARETDCPTRFYVEWLDTTNPRTTERRPTTKGATSDE
jgi:hypothetical protein